MNKWFNTKYLELRHFVGKKENEERNTEVETLTTLNSIVSQTTIVLLTIAFRFQLNHLTVFAVLMSCCIEISHQKRNPSQTTTVAFKQPPLFHKCLDSQTFSFAGQWVYGHHTMSCISSLDPAVSRFVVEFEWKTPWESGKKASEEQKTELETLTKHSRTTHFWETSPLSRFGAQSLPDEPWSV